ncbi:MAG: spermidine synthase, partial [Planctomycetota bacterium]
MERSIHGAGRGLLSLLPLFLLLLFLGACPQPEPADGPPDPPPDSGETKADPDPDRDPDPDPKKEKLVHEVKSDYSHIRIRDKGNYRALLFVRDTGEEVTETAIDRKTPHKLVIPYTQYMFLSYLFRPEHEKVLIVGLGGGGMVHFLNHYFPDLKVDAVEIDPVVVKLADEYFGTRPGPKTRIFTEDAFKYLARAEDKYDVIYM